MADAISIQELIDARTDAKTLEQAVNGDAVTTVLSRLGETYPSLSNALNQIDSKLDSADTQIKQGITNLFESGGLPATPFATKSLMESSELVDGDYAMVTDDTVADDSGLYIKEGDTWIKSKYDISKTILKTKKELQGRVELDVQQISGKAVLPYNLDTNPITGQNDETRLVNVIDVRGYSKVHIIKAKTIESTTDEWRWIATNSAMSRALGASDFTGTGVFELPENTSFIIRNANLRGVIDVDVIVGEVFENEFNLHNLQKDIYNVIEQTQKDILNVIERTVAPDEMFENADFEIISGYSVNTNSSAGHLLVAGSDRAVFKINVEGAGKLQIKNGGTKESGLGIAFSDEGINRLGYANSSGDGIYDVPKGAKFAFRTHTFPPSHNYIESDEIEFILIYRSVITEFDKKIGKLQTQLNYVSERHLLDQSVNGFERYSHAEATQKAQDIIASSDKTVFKISDFEGSSSEEKIKNGIAYIRNVGKGILDLESGTHLLSEALLLPSHCWLYLNNATLKLEDYVFDNIIRSEGIVPNPDPFMHSEVINKNVDIRIFGNGYANCAIKGQTTPYKAANPSTGVVETWTDDNYGWRTIGILFANVDDFQMHDFHMNDLHSWAICIGNGCNDFDIGYIDFYNSGINGDGVHIINGTSNGRVHDLTGYTADDTVGITATRDFTANHPDRHYVYPMAVGGWGYNDNWSIDVNNIIIERIYARGDNQCIRLLVNNKSKIYNITINDIKTKSGFPNRAIVIGSGWGVSSDWGDLYSLYINNVETATSRASIDLDAKMQDVFINNVKQRKEDGVPIGYKSLYHGENVNITNARTI